MSFRRAIRHKMVQLIAAPMAVASVGACSAGPVAETSPPPMQQAAERPNMLFILVDDMGFADLSLTGNKLARTPNIDALARDGMVMTRFYDAAPICSPSRAAFMTGQFPAEQRFVTFISDRRRNERFGQADWLNPSIPVLPRTLQKKGYATGHFGKWHLGGGRDVGDAPLPAAYGFDESYTQFEGLGPRLLPSDLNGNLARQSAALGKGPIEWAPRAAVTARYVDKTLDFIRRSKDRPWFAQLWLDDVHTPWVPSAQQLAAVKGKGRNEREDRFLAVLVAMDAEIGRLVDGMRKAGELDETLIIFTSDNGPTVGSDTPGSADPYRGRKASLYEGGVRQPLIVRWPGHVKAGSRDATTVAQAVDLFPTLSRIAGAQIPAGADGIDIGRAWQGRPITDRPDFYMHIARPAREAEFGPLFSIRSGPWKLLANRDGSGAELYNLEADPEERNDLHAKEQAVTARLSSQLGKWIASLPTPGTAVGS
jgi:arylsulfatase A-like enzyme